MRKTLVSDARIDSVLNGAHLEATRIGPGSLMTVVCCTLPSGYQYTAFSQCPAGTPYNETVALDIAKSRIRRALAKDLSFMEQQLEWEDANHG